MNRRYNEVKRKVFAALKLMGFRVRGKVAWRDTDGNWEIVEFWTRRKWDDRPGETEFCVVVGVHLARVRAEHFPEDDLPSTGKVDDYGSLSAWVNQDPSDVEGFRLNESTDIDALAAKIVDGLERFGLPWLEARRTEEGFIRTHATVMGSVPIIRDMCILLWKQGRQAEYDEMKQRLRRTCAHENPDRFETFFADLESGVRRPYFRDSE